MTDRTDRQIKITSGVAIGTERLGGVLLGLVFALVLYRTAWVGDDAIISFHQARLLVAGDGMVWNPGVRVQAFTHPAWFGLISLVHLLTGALFYPVIILSILMTTAAVLILWAFTRLHATFSEGWAVIFVLSLLLSRGFVDYGTSGLEQPLSFLLSAVAIWMVMLRPLGVGIWLVLALLVLNRMDHAVLFGPLALALLAQTWREGRIWIVLPGALLILSWLVFATIYFGSPLPNTFYAKVTGGVPLDEKLVKGVTYIRDAALRDGFTLVIIGLGILAGLSRGGYARFFALGLVLQMVYLIWIGGDFMRGRFIALPFFLSLFLIAAAVTPRRAALCGIVMIGLGVAMGQPPSLDHNFYHHTVMNGVADERGFYFQRYGLNSPVRAWPVVPQGSFADAASAKTAHVGCGGIGHTRFGSEPQFFVVDSCALIDPFVARLPLPDGISQRVGHTSRRLPANYDAAVTGRAPPSAGGALFDEMMLIATGPIWSSERLAAIGRRLLGMGAEAPDVFRTGGSEDVFFFRSSYAKPWDEAMAEERAQHGGEGVPWR